MIEPKIDPRPLLVEVADIMRRGGRRELAAELVTIAEAPEEPTMLAVANALDRDSTREPQDLPIEQQLGLVVALKALMTAVSQGAIRAGGCAAYDKDGHVCGQPVAAYDPRFGFMVCGDHAPMTIGPFVN